MLSFIQWNYFLLGLGGFKLLHTLEKLLFSGKCLCEMCFLTDTLVSRHP